MNIFFIFIPFFVLFTNTLILRFGSNVWGKSIRYISLFLSVAAASVFTFLLFFTFPSTDIIKHWTWNWWSLGGPLNGPTLDIGIYWDIYTAQICWMVTGVSLLIQIYSTAYLKQDQRLNRFLSFICLFTVSMLGLVVGDGLFSGFIFWELMGVCSFFLISHDLDDYSATMAAVKAYLLTKLGDVFFLLGIILLGKTAGTFNYLELIDYFRENGLEGTKLPLACLLVGIASKSAQVPFYVWLPGAMKGPTPCSALIHAATMVAGGVWVLFRIRPLFEIANMLDWPVYIGGISAILGSIKAIFQREIKSVLAYSTIGHLGFMIFAIGAASGESAILHLTSHAYFKAGLFLAAGVVLHRDSHNDTDEKYQITKIFFGLLSLSLVGAPFFTGHLSKDVLISLSWNHGIFAKAVGVSMLVISPIYASKLFSSIFINNDVNVKPSKNERWSFAIHFPLLFLTICSLAPIFKIISPAFYDVEKDEVSVFPSWLTLLILVVGLLFGFFLSRRKSIGEENKILSKAPFLDFVFKDILWVAFGHRLAFVSGKFDVDVLDKYIVDGWSIVNKRIYKIVGWFDLKIIDTIVDFFGLITKTFNLVLRIFQSGKIQFYIVVALLSVVVIWLKFVRL